MTSEELEDTALEAWQRVMLLTEGARPEIRERPDRDSPGVGGCDAIVARADSPQAVEHTTIDAYADQRRDTAHFMRAFMPLGERVAARFPDSWIEVFVPAHAVPPQQNPEALGERVFERACETMPSLPISDMFNLDQTRFDFEDLPFPVFISRQELAGQEPACFFTRVAPPDRKEQLVANIVAALEKKSKQLRPYRARMSTVLLIDFDDISLLNQYAVAEAFAEAAGRWTSSDSIDEVYLVDRRRRRGIWVFPVKLGGVVYPELEAEFQRCRREQFKATYGHLPSW